MVGVSRFWSYRGVLDSFTIDPERSEVRITYQRHPTAAEWVRMMRAVFADERFRDGFHFLFDKRQAADAATTSYVMKVASFYREHRHRFGRCAILVGDELAFGMARMTEGFCMDDDVRAFTDLGEAERWLQTGESGDEGASIPTR